MRSPVKPIPAELREFFSIQQQTNFETQSGLVRVIDRGPAKAGSFAGYLFVNPKNNKKYWRLHFNSKKYWIHRVIYFLHTGVDPLGFEIDHDDGNSLNNKPSNLILSDRSSNTHNSKIRSDNTSGVCGVTARIVNNRVVYIASLVDKGQLKLKETFLCKIEAAVAYNNTVKEILEPRLFKAKLADLSKVDCPCPACKR